VENRQQDAAKRETEQRASEVRQREAERQAAENRQRETIKQATEKRAQDNDTAPIQNPRREQNNTNTTQNQSSNPASSQPSTNTTDRPRLQDTQRRNKNQDNATDLNTRDGGKDRENRTGNNATKISPLDASPSTNASSNNTRRLGTGRRNPTQSGINGDSTSPSNNGEQSRISEVRKRLGGLGQDASNKAPDRHGQGTQPIPPKPDDHTAINHPPKDKDNEKQQGDIKSKPDLPPGADKHPGTDKHPPHDSQPTKFPERVKLGELDHVVAGDTAQKLKISEQYKLWGDGDVARRLDLQKHAAGIRGPEHGPHIDSPHGPPPDIYEHHPNFYYGWVSPAYMHHCVQFNYWGPSFFSGVCWYPTWNPWVEWSWHHHCHPRWDPRPIWCRPVVYDPCPAWEYYEIPDWRPLPVVVCGTWVNVPPVIVEAHQTDLELLAVRFVDPGHPEENLGPRYRVWFRNNSDEPVTQPFNVVLFASNDGKLVAGLPQAGVRVASIEANDTQSVDIRLPIEVYRMGRDANGKPAPFSTLHVLVDANREISETTRADNGAQLVPAEILPVDPAVFEVEPAAASAGNEILLAGEGLGPQPGQVLVVVDGKEIDAEILGWYDLGVRFTMPKTNLAIPTNAEVVVIRGDGAASNPLPINLKP
jgi:hypothetical protein